MFERDVAGVVPTPVAQALYSRLRPALADLEAAYLEMRDTTKIMPELLRVGLVPFLSKGVMAGLMPSLLIGHPDLAFQVTENAADELVAQVQAGDLDLAILSAEGLHRRVSAAALIVEPLVLISSAENHDVPLGAVDLLSVPPLKLAVSWTGDATGDPTVAILSAGHVPVNEMVNVSSFAAMLQLVRQSDWMALVPGSVLGGNLEGLAVRTIMPPRMIAKYCVVRSDSAQPNPVAEFFIQGLRHALKRAQLNCARHSNVQLDAAASSRLPSVGQADTWKSAANSQVDKSNHSLDGLRQASKISSKFGYVMQN